MERGLGGRLFRGDEFASLVIVLRKWAEESGDGRRR